MTPALASRIASRAAVAAAYFGIAIVRTFPLIARPGTSLPARHTDVFGFVWNNWWLFHAVTHGLSKPYVTTSIFAPFRLDLRLHTAGFLNALLAIPFFPWVGQVGVLNLQVFAAVVLNGYAMFTLAAYVARDGSIGFLCGLLIAATEAINFHLGSGRPSCAALWPAIFAVYFSLRTLDAPTLRNAALCAVFIGAMFLMDQQVALFGSVWLSFVGVDALMRRGRSLLRRPVLLATALPMLVGALAAYLLYFRALKYDVGYAVPGADEAVHDSPGIDFFGHPTYIWMTYGTVLPIAAVVALLLVRRLPEIRVWALGAWAFLVLTLGPVIHGTRIPLPFALVRNLPGMAQFRFPYRFQRGAVLGATIALGLMLARARSQSLRTCTACQSSG